MSGKPGPLTASAARAPPGVSAADGGRGPSVRTGAAGISNRVLIASPRSPRRAAVEAGSGPVRPQPQLTALTSPAQAHKLTGHRARRPVPPVALAPGRAGARRSSWYAAMPSGTATKMRKGSGPDVRTEHWWRAPDRGRGRRVVVLAGGASLGRPAGPADRRHRRRGARLAYPHGAAELRLGTHLRGGGRRLPGRGQQEDPHGDRRRGRAAGP